jgi:hypothetical protein
VPSDWKTYTDSELGVSFPAPNGLTRTENQVQLTEIGKVPATVMTQVGYRADGKGVLGIATTPNPAGVSLEDWIRTVPGWACEPGASPTCEPKQVQIAGERGIYFSLNVLGDPAATVYFAHNDSIYIMSGNVYGTSVEGPALNTGEFQAIIDGLRFDAP